MTEKKEHILPMAWLFVNLLIIKDIPFEEKKKKNIFLAC